MPRIRITKSAIDALPTPKSDVVYWDFSYPGFGVKITPKGRKVFIVLYRTGGTGSRLRTLFSGQITQRIYQATGLRMTVHQFRHAAGALLLQRRPGEYELVRQLLGHRNVQTTINAYIGLENIQASEIFSNIVVEHMEDELEAAE